MDEQPRTRPGLSSEVPDPKTLLGRLQRSEELLERLSTPGLSGEALDTLRREAEALRGIRGELGLLLKSWSLIADTSHRLLNLPPDELESGIRASLMVLGRHIEAQRCYVNLVSEDGQQLVDTYEWCAPGVEPHGLEAYRGKSTAVYTWSLQQFREGRTVAVPDTALLPAEAAAERRICERLGVRAYVNMPLVLGGQLLGWMGFDTVATAREWSPESLHLLGLSADVLGGAIERKRRHAMCLHEKELEQRAESLGLLAAGIAHEINNPLAYTAGNLEYLRERLPCPQDAANAGPDDCHQVLEEALEGTTRIQRIVADLRSMATTLPESSSTEPVDLKAVIESTLRVAANQLRHRAQVVRDYGVDLPRVRGTSTKLGQVLLNLVLNAANAIPEGRYSENRVTLSVRPEAQGVLLAVSDTGCGIPPEVLPRIFDPFFTTRGPRGGMGMGLAICRSLITSLGGSISVRSKPGHGTTVDVYLPRAEEEPKPAPELKPVPASGGRRVLVVDDEPRVLELVRRLLRGHELVTAANGREALERLRADRDFDLILCDLMMPELTGMDVYHSVQATWPGLQERIAFITGGAFTPETRRFLQQVTNPLLTKPFEPAHIRQLVTASQPRPGA